MHLHNVCNYITVTTCYRTEPPMTMRFTDEQLEEAKKKASP